MDDQKKPLGWGQVNKKNFVTTVSRRLSELAVFATPNSVAEVLCIDPQQMLLYLKVFARIHTLKIVFSTFRVDLSLYSRLYKWIVKNPWKFDNFLS